MTKSKFQKKKDREKRVRQQVLQRRERIRAEARERKKLDEEERAVRPKQQPITNEEYRKAQWLHDMEIKMQLEHNMDILKALEEEYDAEIKKRQDYMEHIQTEQTGLEEVSGVQEVTEEPVIVHGTTGGKTTEIPLVSACVRTFTRNLRTL